MGTKKATAKSNKSGEQLRKEAIAVADANIARIEASEKGEAAFAKEANVTQKKAKGAPVALRAKNRAKAAETPQSNPSAAKDAKAKTTKATKAPKPAKEKRMSGLDYAAQVLTASKEPLNAVSIAERAIASGWKTEGATPHATLYSAMLREITTKGTSSRFKKVDRGRFTAGSKQSK